MLVFLAIAGTTFATLGDNLTPTKPVLLGKPSGSGPRIVARGTANDIAIEGGTADLGARDAEARRLRGPWTLRGRVTGEAATGEETAMAVGLELVPIGEGRHVKQALLSGRTDANGGYAWDGLLPGQYRLRALPGVEASSHLAVAVDLELSETKELRQEAEHDVLLPLPRTMRGVVRDKNDQPVKGSRISISETGLYRGSAVVDASGSFTIDRVGLGPWEIKLREEGGRSLPVTQVLQQRASTDIIEVAVVTP